MIKKLIIKDFRLAMHPTVIMFFFLGAMVLIPNYPYYVTFFYACLGLFFTCLNGRENYDIYYSLQLPVRKKDIVISRILFVIIIQLLQVIITIPFLIIRNSYKIQINSAGMDANIALIGLSLIIMAIFNLVFFTLYYSDVSKVGKAFGIGSVAFFIVMIIFEIIIHFIPFFVRLDTPGNINFSDKIIILIIGIVFYIIANIIAAKKSVKLFLKSDF